MTNPRTSAQFLQLFGTTKERRIKTDTDQTDLFLLAKTKTFKEIGFNQRFNLYLEAHKFFRGFSFRAAYEYFKHGEDKIWLFDNQFSNFPANTAQSLRGWTTHEILFILKYDPIDYWKCKNFVPRVDLFYKYPFNGTRAVLASTIGVDFSLSF